MILPQGFIDELREKIVLSDVIRRRVKLTHRGKEALGLCPSHKEKTPSFEEALIFVNSMTYRMSFSCFHYSVVI